MSATQPIRACLSALAVTLPLLALSMPAQASSIYVPDYTVIGDCLSTGAHSNSVTATGTTAQVTACGGPFGSTAGGSASAGHLSAFANNATGSASYEDLYLVSGVPSLAGTAGSVKMSFHVDGLSVGAATSGAVLMTLGDDYGSISLLSLPISNASSYATTVSGSFSFIFGASTDKQVELEVISSGGMIDFSHTALLTGISVYDAAGHPVTASVTGGSGIDYEALAAANAALIAPPPPPPPTVPEPLTLSIFGIGLLGLRTIHRRRTVV